MLKLSILEFWGPWITILVCSPSREGYNHVSYLVNLGVFLLIGNKIKYISISRQKKNSLKGKGLIGTPPKQLTD